MGPSLTSPLTTRTACFASSARTHAGADDSLLLHVRAFLHCPALGRPPLRIAIDMTPTRSLRRRPVCDGACGRVYREYVLLQNCLSISHRRGCGDKEAIQTSRQYAPPLAFIHFAGKTAPTVLLFLCRFFISFSKTNIGIPTQKTAYANRRNGKAFPKAWVP